MCYLKLQQHAQSLQRPLLPLRYLITHWLHSSIAVNQGDSNLCKLLGNNDSRNAGPV